MGELWAGAAAALLGAVVGGIFTHYATRAQDRRKARAQILVVELRSLHDLVAGRTALAHRAGAEALVGQDGEIGYRWSTLEIAAAAASRQDLDRLNGFQAAWDDLGKATTPDEAADAWNRMNDILKAYDTWLRAQLHKRWT